MLVASSRRLPPPTYLVLDMHFSASFLSVVAALFAVGANANPVATAPEADLNARTTIFSGDGESDSLKHLSFTNQLMCLSPLATWYTPDGNVGVCGAPMQNSDFIVALSSAHYHDGAHCWQHLDVECLFSIKFQLVITLVTEY